MNSGGSGGSATSAASFSNFSAVNDMLKGFMELQKQQLEVEKAKAEVDKARGDLAPGENDNNENEENNVETANRLEDENHEKRHISVSPNDTEPSLLGLLSQLEAYLLLKGSIASRVNLTTTGSADGDDRDKPLPKSTSYEYPADPTTRPRKTGKDWDSAKHSGTEMLHKSGRYPAERSTASQGVWFRSMEPRQAGQNGNAAPDSASSSSGSFWQALSSKAQEWFNQQGSGPGQTGYGQQASATSSSQGQTQPADTSRFQSQGWSGSGGQSSASGASPSNQGPTSSSDRPQTIRDVHGKLRVEHIPFQSGDQEYGNSNVIPSVSFNLDPPQFESSENFKG